MSTPTMMEDNARDQVRPPSGTAGVDWNDPTIPAGNSPPLAAWPMWLTGGLWLGCIAFLLWTMTHLT